MTMGPSRRVNSSLKVLLSAVLCTCSVSIVMAQSTPFDMSPENSMRVEPPVAPPRAVPVPVPANPVPANPVPSVPQAAPVAPAVPVAPAIPVSTPAVNAASLSRSFIPTDELRLVGESDRQAYQVFLTEAQANAQASLQLGYLNAIVVAPEASNLHVRINGTSVMTNPIASPEASRSVSAEIPAGILRTGANRIEIGVDQRHRTDCSIGSTYELWTEIDPKASFIKFAGTGLDRVGSLEDLPAVGFNAVGVTDVRLFAPGMTRPEVAATAMELVQAIALAMRAADVNIEVVDQPPTTAAPGVLNVILAGAGELPALASSVQPQAASGPLAVFLPANVAANTLVISGPEWASVRTAARTVKIADPNSASAVSLAPRYDRPYTVPILTGATTVNLSDLGIETVEFNGRHFRTSFAFALPADFYANMYGQAQLILDAGYTREVLPGSQIDLYVNGQIASATPVLRTDGGLLRDTPINFPMTNFRPGRNLMEIEVLLLTQSDEVCAPGAMHGGNSRFLLSASSQLKLPTFARIAQSPDLRALVGTGAPYALGAPTKVLLGRGAQVMPAALTWLARLGISAGTIIAVDPVAEVSPDPSANALIVGALNTLPDEVVGRSGVARTTMAAGSGEPSLADDDAATLNRWRDSIAGDNSNPFIAVRDGITGWLGLKPDNFWLLRSQDGAYLPQSSDAVIMAQALQPEGGVWTYLSMPDETNFVTGVQRLVEPANWRTISGRVSALGPDDAAVLTVQPIDRRLLPTQPWSFENMRLIAANWLSTYVVEYAALLAGIALLLTVATLGLLRIVGRNE